jgi:hypothetical protein
MKSSSLKPYLIARQIERARQERKLSWVDWSAVVTIVVVVVPLMIVVIISG